MNITRREAVTGVAIMASANLINTETTAKRDMSPINQIRALDYTVIFARDMEKMKAFYRHVMQFPVVKQLGEAWIEFQVGANTLALTPKPAGGMIQKDVPAVGISSLQLAFRVTPKAVDECAQYLEKAGVPILDKPKDQQWGHRTLFFQDPDENVLEIYAEI